MVIVTPGFVFDPVLWQIVTFRAPVVPVRIVVDPAPGWKDARGPPPREDGGREGPPRGGGRKTRPACSSTNSRFRRSGTLVAVVSSIDALRVSRPVGRSGPLLWRGRPDRGSRRYLGAAPPP